MKLIAIKTQIILVSSVLSAAALLVFAPSALAVKKVPDNSAHLQPIPLQATPNIEGNINFNANQPQTAGQQPGSGSAGITANPNSPGQSGSPQNPLIPSPENTQAQPDAQVAATAADKLPWILGGLVLCIIVLVAVLIRIRVRANNLKKEIKQ